MIDRDTVGRIGGLLLFAAFLTLQISRLGEKWPVLAPESRLNGLLIVLTASLFLLAYLIRGRAVEHARGYMETLYPLFTSSLPMAIHYSPVILDVRSSSHSWSGTLNALLARQVLPFFHWPAVSTGLMVVGNAVTLCGMIFLRRSFSILPEARAPVFRGIYAYVRHPLYLGEMTAALGLLLSSWSPLNVALAGMFCWGQWVRSGMEEAKLVRAFPEYEAYRQRTGRFLPRRFWPRG